MLSLRDIDTCDDALCQSEETRSRARSLQCDQNLRCVRYETPRCEQNVHLSQQLMQGCNAPGHSRTRLRLACFLAAGARLWLIGQRACGLKAWGLRGDMDELIGRLVANIGV